MFRVFFSFRFWRHVMPKQKGDELLSFGFMLKLVKQWTWKYELWNWTLETIARRMPWELGILTEAEKPKRKNESVLKECYQNFDVALVPIIRT